MRSKLNIQKLGRAWSYMIVFFGCMLCIMGFYNHDYCNVFTGLFMINFSFCVYLSADFYAHCHGIKIWDDEKKEENVNVKNEK